MIPSDRESPSHPAKQTNPSTVIGGDTDSGIDVPPVDSYDLDDDEALSDDWVIDDEHPKRIPPTSDAHGHSNKLSKSTRSIDYRHSATEYSDSQQPFQPGATKPRQGLDSIGNSRRYMAFNSLGLVHVLEKDSGNIVTVEFHDRSKRGPYHFTDRSKFSLCSISDLGVAFACASNTSGTGESLVRYDPYENWATEGLSFAQLGEAAKDNEGGWQYLLPQGENATCLACGGCVNEDGDFGSAGVTGSGTIAVGTDKGYIRLLTGSGIQSYVWNLGQQIISLACSNEWMFAVHRALADSGRALQYTIMDTDTFEIIQEGNIPLPNDKTYLTWIGFTEKHHIPACFDSTGVLSFLDKARRPRQGRWVPVLDTANLQKPDGLSRRAYWTIGASEQQMSCIILKVSFYLKTWHSETPCFTPAKAVYPYRTSSDRVEKLSPAFQRRWYKMST